MPVERQALARRKDSGEPIGFEELGALTTLEIELEEAVRVSFRVQYLVVEVAIAHLRAEGVGNVRLTSLATLPSISRRPLIS